ncbi:hypothetical protein [Mollivirus kamchatka]|nr:hypothetical protein [Mollivirus kamchatka]
MSLIRTVIDDDGLPPKARKDSFALLEEAFPHVIKEMYDIMKSMRFQAYIILDRDSKRNAAFDEKTLEVLRVLELEFVQEGEVLKFSNNYKRLGEIVLQVTKTPIKRIDPWQLGQVLDQVFEQIYNDHKQAQVCKREPEHPVTRDELEFFYSMCRIEKTLSKIDVMEVYAERHGIEYLNNMRGERRLRRQYSEYLANCIYHHHLTKAVQT